MKNTCIRERSDRLKKKLKTDSWMEELHYAEGTTAEISIEEAINFHDDLIDIGLKYGCTISGSTSKSKFNLLIITKTGNDEIKAAFDSIKKHHLLVGIKFFRAVDANHSDVWGTENPFDEIKKRSSLV